MATFTEFYCDPVSGSNLNGGSDAGSPSMSDTAGTGSWTSTTNTYVSVATTGSVSVGQFISIYQTGATAPAYIGRITAVSGGGGSVWTITVSATAVAGAKPTTGTTFFAKVGGAWAGPTGTVSHPFGFIAAAAKDVAGDPVRVNFLNTATYSITAAMTHNTSGPVRFQGMASTPGDGGKAIIDGGVSGSSYTLLTHSASGSNIYSDLIFQNNGATGSADGFVASAATPQFLRCVVNNIAGNGFKTATSSVSFIECEAYACNQSNTANTGGFSVAGTASFVRCISHDNAGSNSCGFRQNVNGSVAFVECVADTNGGPGFNLNSSVVGLYNCDSYNNGGDGIATASTTFIYVENCNLVKNGGYGINVSGTSTIGTINNCGFGSGSEANTSGQTNGVGSVNVNGSITYASGVTPWVDPDNGNFSITLAAAEYAGRGNFTETASSYSGTVGYPDIGAAQHQKAGGVSGSRIFSGF